MTDNPQNALFDFASDDSHTGFRLQRLEACIDKVRSEGVTERV